MTAKANHARATVSARAWVVSFLVAVIALPGCISVDLLGGGEESPLVESVIRGRGEKKILLLDVSGVIGEADATSSLFGGTSLGTAARIAESLDRAREDEEVAAILLRIDSPGGTATESEQVYEEILRFRTERRLPVVAQFLGTATSGAYYVAMAADTLQAHPTTVTGSIGVVFTSLSVAGLMEKLGVEDQTLTAGRWKDAGSPFRRLEAEERRQLQAIVDDLHARFREIVARGRPELSAEAIGALAQGQVFSARDALEKGLVDRIGSLDDAVRELERRLGGSARVVAYHRPREVRRNLYTRGPGAPRLESGPGGVGPSDATLALLAAGRIERLFGTPGFHYVWWPGIGWPGVQ